MYSLLFEEKVMLRVGLDRYLALFSGDSPLSGAELGFPEEAVPSGLLDVLRRRPLHYSFHLPYHVPTLPLDAALIDSDRDALRAATRKSLHFVRAMATSATPPVVIHLSSDASQEKNRRYLDTLLELMEREQLPGRLLLENLQDIATPRDIKHLLDEFATPRLGFCLDLTHLTASEESLPDLLPDHLHFHGFRGAQRHLPLSADQVALFRPFLDRYSSVSAVYELLDCPDYLEAVEQTLSWL